MSDLFDAYPYASRFPVLRAIPEQGRDRDQILAELRLLAQEEDSSWQGGQCSGTMYSGDHAHYGFLEQAFGLFGHANALQRDLCPSATRFEGEVIAMTLDLMHADAARSAGHDPVGMMTGGGTASILQAMLAYRDHAATYRSIDRPNVVRPSTAHPAFAKAAHLFGMELRTIPVDPQTTLVDPEVLAEQIDDNTVAIIGSAGNYPYGTIDPIAELGALALERGVGLHVDGCLGGFLLPFAEQLGYPIPAFDFRVPGVTSISADTHKYAYGLKGTSTVLFRDKEVRNAAYFADADWVGGKYFSPGMEGSRSTGLLASAWASLVATGAEGYRQYAREIFEASYAMQAAVRSHPDLRLLGDPTFLFAFTSDSFDPYHVSEHMARKGWRFNGLQYPNGVHFAVTRPQTQPGVTDRFAADLAEAVAYAQANRDTPSRTGAIYGGFPGGPTPESGSMLELLMGQLMDAQLSVPTP